MNHLSYYKHFDELCHSLIRICLFPGPPLKPINFSVIDVTAVSIRVQWITGFNGGLEQTFTIRYTNVATGVVMEKSGIEDRGVGDGQMITDDITDGIEPETEYQLQIFASNSQGQTAGDVISAHTPGVWYISGSCCYSSCVYVFVYVTVCVTAL